MRPLQTPQTPAPSPLPQAHPRSAGRSLGLRTAPRPALLVSPRPTSGLAAPAPRLLGPGSVQVPASRWLRVCSGSFALGAALAQTPLPVRAPQTAGPEPRRGADVCGEAAAAPHGGRWRTPVSPACVHSPPRPVRVEEKQLDSEVPQDTRRLPGRTAALSSRPGACHRHPGSRALVASLPEASPLSETFCIPLGLLKISF